jgi:hypothetical protein
MTDTLNQKTGELLYKEIALEGNTAFTDEEAERAAKYCLEGYTNMATEPCSYAAVVNINGGDWSGMLRNMLCGLRDKQQQREIPLVNEDTKTAYALGFDEGVAFERRKHKREPVIGGLCMGCGKQTTNLATHQCGVLTI